MQSKEKLRRRKVRIISITQAFGDNSAADLSVGMLALFDEYHSCFRHPGQLAGLPARLRFLNTPMICSSENPKCFIFPPFLQGRTLITLGRKSGDDIRYGLNFCFQRLQHLG